MADKKKIQFVIIQGSLFDEESSMLKGMFSEDDYEKAMEEIVDEMLELYKQGIISVFYFDDEKLCGM
jgi:NADPH-dependent curcumin reductase CurA